MINNNNNSSSSSNSFSSNNNYNTRHPQPIRRRLRRWRHPLSLHPLLSSRPLLLLPLPAHPITSSSNHIRLVLPFTTQIISLSTAVVEVGRWTTVIMARRRARCSCGWDSSRWEVEEEVGNLPQILQQWPSDLRYIRKAAENWNTELEIEIMKLFCLFFVFSLNYPVHGLVAVLPRPSCPIIIKHVDLYCDCALFVSFYCFIRKCTHVFPSRVETFWKSGALIEFLRS